MIKSMVIILTFDLSLFIITVDSRMHCEKFREWKKDKALYFSSSNNFFMFFLKKTLYFYFSLGPTHYVTGPVFLNISKHLWSVYYISTMVLVTWSEGWEGKAFYKPFIFSSQQSCNFGGYSLIRRK